MSDRSVVSPPSAMRRTGSAMRVPDALRSVAQFPADGDAEAEAGVWADVLALASRELALLSKSADSWTEESRTRTIAKVDEATRLAAAAKAPLLAAQERSGGWRGTGARRFEDYLATQSRAGKGQARREAQAARTISQLDGGHAALVDGTLTPSHVDRLGTVLGKLPEEKRELLLAGDGAEKVKKLAQRHNATDFGRRVEDLAASLTPKAIEDAHQAARSRRYLELTPTADGMTRLTGLLDAVGAHTVRLALDAASPRPGEDDDRTPAQRTADALTSIASNSLREAKASGNARAQILITMTADTFAQARAHLAAATHLAEETQPTAETQASAQTQPTAGTHLADGTDSEIGTSRRAARGGCDGADNGAAVARGPAPAVRLQDGPVLPPSELARVLCDSEIARLVIGADSEPLDLGRSVRLYSPAQRRAVIARDQGCFWEGCTIPSRFCEVHHLDWWDEDEGHTDISRGVLACTFHHGQLHSRKLDVTTAKELREHLRGTEASSPPPPDGVSTLPGDSAYSPPSYRTVPRSTTEKQRGEAKRARLLTRIRDESDERRSRLRELEGPPGSSPVAGRSSRERPSDRPEQRGRGRPVAQRAVQPALELAEPPRKTG